MRTNIRLLPRLLTAVVREEPTKHEGGPADNCQEQAGRRRPRQMWLAWDMAERARRQRRFGGEGLAQIAIADAAATWRLHWCLSAWMPESASKWSGSPRGGIPIFAWKMDHSRHMASEGTLLVQDKAQKHLQYEARKAPSLLLPSTPPPVAFHAESESVEKVCQKPAPTATVRPDMLGGRSMWLRTTLFGPSAGTELALVRWLGALARCAFEIGKSECFFFFFSFSLRFVAHPVRSCAAMRLWLG
jgi:hypothetical protein